MEANIIKYAFTSLALIFLPSPNSPFFTDNTLGNRCDFTVFLYADPDTSKYRDVFFSTPFLILFCA